MDGCLWIACVGGSHRKVEAFQHVWSQIRPQFLSHFRADKQWNGAFGVLTGLAWAGMGWPELAWAGLGWPGLAWAGLGWAELAWAGLGWPWLA